jgi:3-methylcrotonyl-CoA carboxylase alpha subunit
VVIRRLLIANRGEIAVRIIRACRERGIESVAVFSQADAKARHVRLADRAVAIGGSASSESYLASEKILDAARSTGADAIHPGYGFLSQNATFAEACESAGIVFVGPGAKAIASMGSKIEARRLVEQAGVPVVPGELPRDQTDAGVGAAIDRLGLPALVKASAGGGGKGMRPIRTKAEVADEVPAARREAIAAFGDGTLYVERLLDRPRHVEVQVFGDRHGGFVHVFERECSVQRRHQKIIEVSPAPLMTPEFRTRITAAAVRVAKAVSYANAGTVEFLVDGTGAMSEETPFYFLEMNTRLQVEHGVTELVTGVDLVHAQLDVAGGERLPWRQEVLAQRGHAIEARVYAEDPSAGFLPQAGRLLLYREPRMPGVRVDSGVGEGDEIGVHYDPLIAKVIAAAESRELAIARLLAALRDFPVLGVRTNIPFLLRVLDHADFRAARIDTGFLDRADSSLFARPGKTPDFVEAALRAHVDSSIDRKEHARFDPWDDADFRR